MDKWRLHKHYSLSHLIWQDYYIKLVSNFFVSNYDENLNPLTAEKKWKKNNSHEFAFLKGVRIVMWSYKKQKKTK